MPTTTDREGSRVDKQLPALLSALAVLITAFGGLELRHRGRAKELIEDRKAAEDRAKSAMAEMSVAQADAFRKQLLLRRVALASDPLPADLRTDIEQETT